MRTAGWLFIAALALGAIAHAAPPWVATVEALLAKAGHGRAALAVLTALPFEVRQTIEYHAELARVAQALDDPSMGAEAAAVATLLLTGPAPDLSGVRAWLAARAGQLTARAFATAAATPDAAARLYLAAVKADGSVLAGDDRGLRERALALVRADAGSGTAPALWELGWHTYFTGDLPGARAAFARAKAAHVDPYEQWRCQLWVDRIDREVANSRRSDAESDARAAKARAEEDARREKADRENAVREQARKEQAARAEREAAKTRLRELRSEIHEIDRAIQTLRERQMIDFQRSGLPPSEAYQFFSELKEQENAERARKKKLEDEKAALEADR